MRRWIRTLVLLVALLVSGLFFFALFHFAVENAQWVLIKVPTVQWDWSDPLPPVEYEARLWAIILVAFAGGFVAAMLFMVIPGWLRRGVERRRERRFIESLEEELADLRNLPVDSPAPLEDIQEDPLTPKDSDDARDPEPGGAVR